MIEGLAAKARRQGVAVYLTGAAPALRRELLAHGARPPLVRYAATIEAALAAAAAARRADAGGYASG